VPACRTKKRQWVIALTAIAVGWPWWALTKLLRTMNAVHHFQYRELRDDRNCRDSDGSGDFESCESSEGYVECDDE
jgi:hypothetical protein